MRVGIINPRATPLPESMASQVEHLSDMLQGLVEFERNLVNELAHSNLCLLNGLIELSCVIHFHLFCLRMLLLCEQDLAVLLPSHGN